MTSNIIDESFNHNHFTIAILISLIIHISFILFGNLQINTNKLNKIKTDIELIIIEKPEIKPTVIESSNNPIGNKINKEIIAKEKVEITNNQKKTLPISKKKQEKLLTKPKAINSEEKSMVKKISEISESSSTPKIKQKKRISTSEIISNLSNLELPTKKINTQRIKNISAKTKDYEYRLYFEAWRQKVERLGALNYPEAAKSGSLGSLKLTVSLSANGKIENIIVNKTSGNKALDEAAIKIIKLGEPYAAFTTRMLKEIDLVNITRTWKFTQDTYSTD